LRTLFVDFLALSTNSIESSAGAADRRLGASQLTGEAIALGGIFGHLFAHAANFALYLRKLGLSASLRRRILRRRAQRRSETGCRDQQTS
jgi:hypothetical protein